MRTPSAPAAERLRAMLGSDAELVPRDHLRPATTREILVRMLTNLKQLYARDGDWLRTLGCCDRLLLLMPDAPSELRDRSVVYERLDCFAAAAGERLERLGVDASRGVALHPGVNRLVRRRGWRRGRSGPDSPKLWPAERWIGHFPERVGLRRLYSKVNSSYRSKGHPRPWRRRPRARRL